MTWDLSISFVALYIYLKQLLAEQEQKQYLLNDDMEEAIDLSKVFCKNSLVLFLSKRLILLLQQNSPRSTLKIL